MSSLKERLNEIFAKEKIINDAQLERALKIQEKKGGRLSDIFAECGFLKQSRLAEILDKNLGLPLFSLECFQVDTGILSLIPVDTARFFQIIPLSRCEDRLNLAISDPLDIFAAENLRQLRGITINPVLLPAAEIRKAIDTYYPADQPNIEELARDAKAPIELSPGQKEPPPGEEDVSRLARDPMTIKAVERIFEEAVKKEASGIFIDSSAGSTRVRFYLPGMLQEQDTFPGDMLVPVISRIKLICGLDVSKRGVVQEGRFSASVLGRRIDMGACVLPAVSGECAVLRVWDKMQADPDMRKIGLSEYAVDVLSVSSRFNHGLVLVCGPERSGRTTTLYALLRTLNAADKNIVTIENPVESYLEGVNQVAVNPGIGLSFAAGLRSILLQDPNVIVIGDLAGYEAMETAVKSALGGHLVFASLNAAGTSAVLSHFAETGIEPYLLGSSLICVSCQALLRKVCPKCAERYTLAREAVEVLKLEKHKAGKLQFYRGKGCSHCAESGYSGKLAISETLKVSQKIREMIIAGESGDVIKRQARLEGMQTLREAGIAAALDGQTTLEEVLCSTLPDL
jgi:type IV pilus assembly protein PilB